ncbi:hypothetical protein BC938DRAFT_483253 [Jimgerdemannia flammicorona]|uniref:Uncharacterized protein n=1 Tax=Jimgerdemannia flammicorona TaxID=994334 RepID=A0A433QCD1_9FUNG|nr:hypothetical protein BC938DRAFT_483253 [Jimgerdemannia flammicorona]
MPFITCLCRVTRFSYNTAIVVDTRYSLERTSLSKSPTEKPTPRIALHGEKLLCYIHVIVVNLNPDSNVPGIIEIGRVDLKRNYSYLNYYVMGLFLLTAAAEDNPILFMPK